MADNKLYEILGVSRDATDNEIKKVSAKNLLHFFCELNMSAKALMIEYL